MSGASARDLFSRVEAYRVRHGVTLASIAAAAGVSLSVIDKLRTGRRINDVTFERVVTFLSIHRGGHAQLIKADRQLDPAEGGAAAVVAAWSRSGAPARPCPKACARAAAEDRRAEQLRQRRAA